MAILKPSSERKKVEKNKGGRPTKYCKEMADRICELIATCDVGYKQLSERYPDLPDRVNVNKWRRKYPEFRLAYAQAKAEQIDFIMDDIIDIADDGTNDFMQKVDEKTGCLSWRFNGEHVQRSRLRVDTRKWIAAKLLPKIYGDFNSNQANNNDIDEDCKKRYAELDERNKKEC